MKRRLGAAVFAGMLGVTAFGVFLTPVFFYVIQWVTDRRAAALAAEREGMDGGPFGTGDNAEGVMLPDGQRTHGSGHGH